MKAMSQSQARSQTFFWVPSQTRKTVVPATMGAKPNPKEALSMFMESLGDTERSGWLKFSHRR